ncbi:MAG: hypothetical protein Q9197_004391 [Variospora fuerteventurae]
MAEIQSQLAQLRGLRAPLSVIPGLLFTVFAGSLADVYGRKPLLLWSFTGWFYGTFSASWVLASPLFLCIGGGSQVLAALLTSIIVDVTPAHLRTATIYMINSAELITEFVSPPIGAALMRTNVWLAFAVSIPVILLSYPVIAAIPETLAPAGQSADTRLSRASSEIDYERRALTKAYVATELSVHLGCVVSSSGSNAPQTLQGLASSFTDGSNTAELYSTLAFAQLVGTMLGGPIAAALFTLGLRLGPDTPWAGLPFYASSVSPT